MTAARDRSEACSAPAASRVPGEARRRLRAGRLRADRSTGITTTDDTERDALGNTTLIRFEVSPGFAPCLAIPCKIPKTVEFWVSTNSKPGS